MVQQNITDPNAFGSKKAENRGYEEAKWSGKAKISTPRQLPRIVNAL